jgi:hypothetical protein
MEKFLGFGGENSETSKKPANISNVFVKADAEIVHASGREVPTTDPRSIKVGGNSRPATDA